MDNIKEQKLKEIEHEEKMLEWRKGIIMENVESLLAEAQKLFQLKNDLNSLEAL